MTKNVVRLCARECFKEGETHEFSGPVKIILQEVPEGQGRWRRVGAAYVAMANMLIAANMAIIILYAFSYKDDIYYSSHCLLCTVGLQFCLPLSILILHSMFGPAATIKRGQRKKEHVLLSLLAAVFVVSGIVIPFLYPRKCLPEIHVILAWVTLGGIILSIITGIKPYFRKSEEECPTYFTIIHRVFGMLTFLASSCTYLMSIGGCQATMRLWLISIGGGESPLYMIYFIVIFYTLIVFFIPGSLFINGTIYNNVEDKCHPGRQQKQGKILNCFNKFMQKLKS